MVYMRPQASLGDCLNKCLLFQWSLTDLIHVADTEDKWSQTHWVWADDFDMAAMGVERGYRVLELNVFLEIARKAGKRT